MTLCRSRRRQVVEIHYCRLFGWAHNPKVGGSNPPPATKLFIDLRASDVFTSGAKKGNKQVSAVKCDNEAALAALFILPLSPLA
jgi:hypothetical protein